MRFLTQSECEAWLQERRRQKPDAVAGVHVSRIVYPQEAYRFYWMALRISQSLAFRMPILLWITEWGIWSSSENWHLYYRLRRSFGDLRLLREAPGHLFLEHETEDFASFLQLAMLNGWGGYGLMQANYVNLFFSHDEYIDLFADTYDLKEFLKELQAERSPEAPRV